VLSGSKAGAEAGERGRRRGGKCGIEPHRDLALALLQNTPEERGVRGFLLQQAAAQAICEDNTDPLGGRQPEPVLEAVHADARGGAAKHLGNRPPPIRWRRGKRG
jgi:hypothetical protein